MLTLDFLKDLAERHGNEIALEDDEVQVSYAELATAVNALAVALQMKDPAAGSRVALCAANSLEYLVSVLAIQAAGKLLLPLNRHGDTEALHALLNEALPTALIVDDEGTALIQCDDDLKIHVSQFAGLVHTYRDHTPDSNGSYPAPVIQAEQAAG
ncbi:AMP-binding protein [Parapusillimonas sp. JC17]|uniref:AMP-binding protein n=1 Tax=Parapusillimonas sp. JC17 TaxID=3445768 RepID=UPI003FA03A06